MPLPFTDFMCLLKCDRSLLIQALSHPLLSLQILVKAADREKEGINVTEAGERV